MASVSILRAKDSILYYSVRTDASGKFMVAGVDTGKYIILVSYTPYADYIQQISIDKTTPSVIDLKNINMLRKATLLNEVIIKDKMVAAVTMKGDTVEFAADSFKVEPNARVEDLLRKLPNIQVDNKGHITAEGQQVKTVLVDGEEFFGDDPTLVIKNIRADMVDKVQLYNGQAKLLSGSTTGPDKKIINIQLKEDKKNGHFGNISGGIGDRKFNEEQLMLNRFTGAEKMALYGLASNDGIVGLNAQDMGSYGDGANIGGTSGLDTWNGNYNGQGLPVVQTAGVHYNNKWASYSLNTNYKTANLDVNGTNNIITQLSLPQSVNYTTADQNSIDYSFRNKFDFDLGISKIANSTVDISASAISDHKTTKDLFRQATTDQQDVLLNDNTRTIANTSDDQELNTGVVWNKKFAKPRRGLSLTVTEEYSSYNSNGYLNSATRFFNSASEADSSRIDQNKLNKSSALNFGAKIAYHEPVFKSSLLTGSYAFSIQNNLSNIRSLNQSSANNYDQLDSLNSSNYQFNRMLHRFGLAYNFKYNKLQFNLANDAGISTYQQLNKFNNNQLNRTFVNWFPQASVQGTFDAKTRIRFSYTGETVQPTITQLQPIASNMDPLNIYVGNPTLNPSFKNTFNLLFSDYKALKDRTFLINSTYSFTTNPISINMLIDSTGRNTYTYYNAANASNTLFNTYVLYGLTIKSLDVELSSNAGVVLNKSVNTTNGQINIVNSNVYNGYIGLQKSKIGKYDSSLGATINYNTSKTSLNPQFNTSYWSYHFSGSGDIHVAKVFQAHAECDYSFQQKTRAFDNNFHQTILNTWVGEKFMQGNLLVKISGNDLLNQNSGFSRIAANNTITQNNYTTIRRFFMLSVSYDFNKTYTAK